MIRLSAFSDEAGKALSAQIAALLRNGISLTELRSVGGKNVKDLTLEEAENYAKVLEQNGIRVWSIGSPVGKVKIGNNVRIASHCMILGGNHRFDDTTKPICKQGLIRRDIVIEDDVWVAGRVNIVAGVTIGHGSVIAAGAVVTKDVPPYSVVAGVPARVIKKRKEDDSL